MTHDARSTLVSPDPLLAALVRHALAVGIALVLLLPAARGSHSLLGWLPLWLVGMPSVALWALHRFPLPRRARTERVVAPPRRARATVQARRRVRTLAVRRARAA